MFYNNKEKNFNNNNKKLKISNKIRTTNVYNNIRKYIKITKKM